MDFVSDKWQAVVTTAMVHPILFVVTWVVTLTATYLGIARGGQERPLSRSHYFVFIIAFDVAIFFIAWIAGLLEGLIGLAGVSIVPLIQVGLVGFIIFMMTRYSARRLREIGWSPQWAWLLLVYVIGYLFMLVLLLTPPTKNVAQRFAGHKAG